MNISKIDLGNQQNTNLNTTIILNKNVLSLESYLMSSCWLMVEGKIEYAVKSYEPLRKGWKELGEGFLFSSQQSRWSPL
jgi:hypothetical protein